MRQVVLALFARLVAGALASCAPGDEQCAARLAARTDASGLMQLSRARPAANLTANDSGITGCEYSTCDECLTHPGLTSCRWCPETQSCHNYGSPIDKCKVPINSLGQCWGDKCPHQIGQFFSNRPDDALRWAETTLAAVGLPLQPFFTYDANKGETGMFDLSTGAQLDSVSGGNSASGVVIAAAADWGSGTCEARVVSLLMQKENPHVTFHLGDVYYVGTEDEFSTNVLGRPRYSHAGSVGVQFAKGSHTTFLMCGNHEILSGNQGLVLKGYPFTGQTTSYGVWQSDSWRIVALDTGYLSYHTFLNKTRNPASESDAPQPQEVIEWLQNVVKLGDPEDKRGIVLMSHHQPFSDWEPSYLGTANQLKEILPPGKQVVWFFGHEHRLALYKELQLEGTDYFIYPRMVGYGGFSDTPSDPNRTNSLEAYDKRPYQQIPHDMGGSDTVGFNGYFKMEINGAKMTVSYVTGKCAAAGCDSGYDENEGTVVATETITVDTSTGALTQEWTMIGPEMTRPQILVMSKMGKRSSGAIAVESSLPRQGSGALYNLNHTSMD